MKAIITGWRNGKFGIGSDTNDIEKEFESISGVTVEPAGDVPSNLGVQEKFLDRGGINSYLVDTTVKAHGIYEYNNSRYVVISSAKQFQYRNLDNWLPLFDTDNGHYLSDELHPQSVGQYWYLVPQEDYLQDVDQDNEPLKYLGSDDKSLEKKTKDLKLDSKVLLRKDGEGRLTVEEPVGLVEEVGIDEVWVTVKSDASTGLNPSNALRKKHNIYPNDIHSDNEGIVERCLVNEACLIDKDKYEKYKEYFKAIGQYIYNDVTFETRGKRIASILIDESLSKENVWFLVEDENTRPGRYSKDQGDRVEVFPAVESHQRLKEVPAWKASWVKGPLPEEAENGPDADEEMDSAEECASDEAVKEQNAADFEVESPKESEQKKATKEKKRFTNMFEDVDVKGAAKNSAKTLGERAKHGMAVGAATEGANYAYEFISDKLHSQFGVSKEVLDNPVNRELVMAVAVAMLHMGSEIFDEQLPGMEKVRSGCELVVEGKMKDNFGTILRTAIPLLVQAKDLMDPKQAMSRLVITNTEKVRVADVAPPPPVEAPAEEELEEEIILEESIPARMG